MLSCFLLQHQGYYVLEKKCNIIKMIAQNKPHTQTVHKKMINPL